MRRYIDIKEYNNLKNDHRFSLLFRIKKDINNRLFIKENLSKIITVGDKELDDKQKECLLVNEDNVLVLAGAGTGKTMTIVGKINYLINDMRVKESEILCLSFTNNTVEELKNRINYNIDIFTFHKLGVEILKDYKVYYELTSNDYLNFVIKEIFYSICNNIDDKDLNYFVNRISNFINIFKVYNYDIEFFNKITKRNKNKLLLLIKKIYLIYIEELDSQGMYDINDLILNSIKYIKEKGFKRYYKYIIIDEYQDISTERYELIKVIKESCSSKLFVVGDDFQSIYKFAGSNIDLIINFKKYFGYTKIIRLNNTYRSPNELIKVATNFVMKNRNQLRKELVSNKSISKPIRIVYYIKNMNIKLKKILDLDYKFLILSRNNSDINNCLDEDISFEDNRINYNNKTYDFKTIHKAKGLEEENVIVLNLSNDYYGFPSKKEDKLINLITPNNKYKYEEERRLFYVALTRSKNYVYLLVDKNNPSIFIKEILKKYKRYIEILDL